MSPQDWLDDDALMRALKEAVNAAGDEDARLLAAAKAAFTWRTVDEELELLSLSYDSATAEAVAVRGAPGVSSRMLVFQNDDLILELEIGSDVVMGQLVPARTDTILLEGPDGPIAEAQVDDAGFFLLRRPAGGPIRLRLDGDAGLTTEWLSI